MLIRINRTAKVWNLTLNNCYYLMKSKVNDILPEFREKESIFINIIIEKFHTYSSF